MNRKGSLVLLARARPVARFVFDCVLGASKLLARLPALDSMCSRVAARLIRLYQVFISPNKGFRCAWSARFGSPSCSDYALEFFESMGFANAMVATKAQLVRCADGGALFRIDQVEEILRILNSLDLSGLQDIPPPPDKGCCSCW